MRCALAFPSQNPHGGLFLLPFFFFRSPLCFVVEDSDDCMTTDSARVTINRGVIASGPSHWDCPSLKSAEGG